jgi:hypothetical protein
MPVWRDTHRTKGCLLKTQLVLHTGDSATNGDDEVIEGGEECWQPFHHPMFAVR